MKSVFLIDGFNFYHSIKKLDSKYHWLNYKDFCAHFLTKNDILTDVYFFTAEAYWIQDAVIRHRVFMDACRHFGVKIILGKFKEKSGYCPKCKSLSIHHEEKYTDVNIALTAYRIAYKQEAEQIFFVTGDTDLVPSIQAIKDDFPNIRIGVIFPYGKHNQEMKTAADVCHKTKKDALDKFIMPRVIVKANGNIITCPDRWIKP